jgi:hypothetical protein
VTPIDELAKWKRADLLQLCKKYGVSKSGNRQVLAQRLIAASDPTALDNIEKSIQNYLGKPRSGVAAMHSFYKEYFNTVDKVNMNEWMTSHPAVLTRGKAKFIHGLVKIPLVNVKCILDYLHWEGDKKFDFDLSRLEICRHLMSSEGRGKKNVPKCQNSVPLFFVFLFLPSLLSLSFLLFSVVLCLFFVFIFFYTLHGTPKATKTPTKEDRLSQISPVCCQACCCQGLP